MKYEIIDVKGDGSCSYRSIYKGLEHLHLRDYLSKNINDEESFVKWIRKYLAKTILDSHDFGIIHKSYIFFKELDNQTYREIIKSSFPRWFVGIGRPKTENEFRIRISNAILDKSNWVSEIEITILKKLFQKKGIHLHIFNSEPSKDFMPEQKTIYILNLDEVHYNAVLYRYKKLKNVVCKSDKMLNPSTNRCVMKRLCLGLKLLVEKNGLL